MLNAVIAIQKETLIHSHGAICEISNLNRGLSHFVNNAAVQKLTVSIL